MSISHVPFWLDRSAKSRRPSYPRLRGEAETSVVIVGGGLTGCACALAFAQAGIKVVLLEADAIGQSVAARSAGLVREDFAASFKETVATHGLAAARSMWQSMRRASLEFQAVLRRLNVRCDLGTEDLLTVAPREPSAAQSLQGEYRARRSAGFNHSWVTPAGVTPGSRTRERRCHSHARREARSLSRHGRPRRRSRGARGAAIPGLTRQAHSHGKTAGRGLHRRRRRAGGGGPGRHAPAAGRPQSPSSSPETSDALFGRDQPASCERAAHRGKASGGARPAGHAAAPPEVDRRGSCALDRC